MSWANGARQRVTRRQWAVRRVNAQAAGSPCPLFLVPSHDESVASNASHPMRISGPLCTILVSHVSWVAHGIACPLAFLRVCIAHNMASCHRVNAICVPHFSHRIRSFPRGLHVGSDKLIKFAPLPRVHLLIHRSWKSTNLPQKGN